MQNENEETGSFKSQTSKSTSHTHNTLLNEPKASPQPRNLLFHDREFRGRRQQTYNSFIKFPQPEESFSLKPGPQSLGSHN